MASYNDPGRMLHPIPDKLPWSLRPILGQWKIKHLKEMLDFKLNHVGVVKRSIITPSWQKSTMMITANLRLMEIEH